MLEGKPGAPSQWWLGWGLRVETLLVLEPRSVRPRLVEEEDLHSDSVEAPDA